MRVWIFACTAAVLLVAVGARISAQSGSPTTVGSAEGSFDELYRRGYQTSVGIKTLTARFTETTTSSLLVRPLVARGTLAVQRPSRVALRFTDPEPRVVLIAGDQMTVSWPARKVQQVSNVASPQRRIQKYLAS